MEYETIPTEHLAFIQRIAYGVVRRLHISPILLSVDELVSAGYLGYRDACRRYDASRGRDFETYAEYRIRGSMFDELRSRDHLHRDVRDRKHQIEAARRVLAQRLGRAPTRGEVAEWLEVTEDAVEASDCIPGHVGSAIDEADEQDRYAAAVESDENGRAVVARYEALELLRRVERATSMLAVRERRVLHARYVERLLQREVAGRLGVSTSRVCQIERDILEKLRRACEVPLAA